MDQKIEPERLTLVLKAAQAYSFFLGIAYGQHEDAPLDDRNWSFGAAASADVAYVSATELLRLCNWTNQPRMRTAIEELIQTQYHYPFTEPQHMAVSDAATFVGRIARGLAKAVEVEALSHEDSAVLLCAFQILGAMWATTDSWNNENLVGVAELGLYFPQSAWLRAANIDVAEDYGPLFRHCSTKELNRLLDAGVTKAAHGFELAPLVVVRRLRALGGERKLRSEIEAWRMPKRLGAV